MTKAAYKTTYKTTGMTIKKLTACLVLFGMFLICNGLLYPSVWNTDFSKKSPVPATTEQIVTTYANKPVIPAEYAETPVTTTENSHVTAGKTTEPPSTADSTVNSMVSNTASGGSNTASGVSGTASGSGFGASAGKNSPTASNPDVSTGRTFAENPDSAEVGTPNARGTEVCTNTNVDFRAGMNAEPRTDSNVNSRTDSNVDFHRMPNINTNNTEPQTVPPAPPREFASNRRLPFPFNLFCPRSSQSDEAKQPLPPVNTLMRNYEADEEIVYIDLPVMDTDGTAENRLADNERSSREPLENTSQTNVNGTLPPLPDDVNPLETTPSPQIGSNVDSVAQDTHPPEVPSTPKTDTATDEIPSLASMLQNRTVPATQASLQEMNRLDKAEQEHDAIIQDLDRIRYKVFNDSKAVIAEMSEQPPSKAVPEELDLNRLKEQSEKPETTTPAPTPEADATAGTPKESECKGLELLPDLELDAETAPTEKAVGSTAGTPVTPAKPADATGTGDGEPTEFPESFGLEELEEAPVNPHFGLREPVKVNAQKPATPAPATAASPPALPTAPTAKPTTPALPSTNVNCGLEELPDEEEPSTPSTVEKAHGPSLKELPGGLEELQEEPEDFPPIG